MTICSQLSRNSGLTSYGTLASDCDGTHLTAQSQNSALRTQDFLQHAADSPLEARQRDRQFKARLSVIEKDLSLHALGIEHFEQACGPLLEAEFCDPQRFLRLPQQSFLQYLDELRRCLRILIILINLPQQFIARSKQFGFFLALGAE